MILKDLSGAGNWPGNCEITNVKSGLPRKDWLAGESACTTTRVQMMKIQLQEFDDQLILRVEGRVAGAFVPELENCWKGAPGRAISVDLENVTCVDRAGRSLFQEMHRSGVKFLRAGIGLRDILDEIIEREGCGQ